MKKIITFLAAIIISLFCLCACGTESGETTTDAGHIHAYGEWQTVREADCVNVGERERTCSSFFTIMQRLIVIIKMPPFLLKI